MVIFFKIIRDVQVRTCMLRGVMILMKEGSITTVVV